ncbi:hypothetical protein L6164_008517 [Bauhinia variegata]|uniref:Uncharacterized protein n=1 Tax=Bauhinia variegata TaxID=167791 RepID=A0ACB9PIB7_BAUVA|nr:hypothetical protein L6164_008517 [Bauhinia variegata]
MIIIDELSFKFVENEGLKTFMEISLPQFQILSRQTGEFMHLSCCTHILNLIVSDGLKEISHAITKIRACCKYVRSSSRLALFKSIDEDLKLPSKQYVILDVLTRWNSCYFMLEVAEKFERYLFVYRGSKFYISSFE